MTKVRNFSFSLSQTQKTAKDTPKTAKNHRHATRNATQKGRHTLLTGCGGGTATETTYEQIDQQTAKEMMDTQEVIVLDVREQDEYDSGHITGAVLLPVGAITADTAAEVIPEKDATVLVYCRSGNRSKTAAAALAALGYTSIYEFGGINTWEYGTES